MGFMVCQFMPVLSVYLGYCIGMSFSAPEKKLGSIHQVTDSWGAFLLLSLCLQLTSWTLIIYWSGCHWHNHPISWALKAHLRLSHTCWDSVAASINDEFRHIDKIATGVPGARVIITDSWMLKVTTSLQIGTGALYRLYAGSSKHKVG